MKHKTVKNTLGMLLVSAVFFACNSNDTYFKYHTLNNEEWHKDSVATFDVLVADISAQYNVYMQLRNTAAYRYQNFWAFITCITPNNTVTRDTVECYLADEHGKWLGSGVGVAFEMPVLFQEKISFDKVGTYRYEIQQGMREDILTGINDIGLRVEIIK